MNNLLAFVDRPRRVPQQSLERALRRAAATEPAFAGQVREILGSTTRRAHYERLHLQYEAMAAALGSLELPGTLDSHDWASRLVEFEPDADERDDGRDEPTAR